MRNCDATTFMDYTTSNLLQASLIKVLGRKVGAGRVLPFLGLEG